MKMLLKQRAFSWLGRYEALNEWGEVLYRASGQFAWTHRFRILDPADRELGTLRELPLTLRPRFELCADGNAPLRIVRERGLARPRYRIEGPGWQAEGDFPARNYSIRDAAGLPVASLRREPFRWTDTYEIQVDRPENALAVLCFALAVAAERGCPC